MDKKTTLEMIAAISNANGTSGFEDEEGLTIYDVITVAGYAKENNKYYEGLDNALTNIYDLIILDVMLPKINGFEILKEIKKTTIIIKNVNNKLKKLQIILRKQHIDKQEKNNRMAHNRNKRRKLNIKCRKHRKTNRLKNRQ